MKKRFIEAHQEMHPSEMLENSGFQEDLQLWALAVAKQNGVEPFTV